VACAEALRDDEIERPPERLIGTLAEDPLSAWIPHANDPFAVRRHHGVGGSGENRVGRKPDQVHSHSTIIQTHLRESAQGGTTHNLIRQGRY
jgi:hypothetical protein